MDRFNRKSFTDGVQTVWDATSVELFQTCPRKYFYSIIENLQPKVKSAHLLFGGIYAAALEVFYSHRAQGWDMESSTLAAVRFAVLEGWDHDRDETGARLIGTGQPISMSHNIKTMPNLLRTLVWYIDQFGDESQSAIKTYHLTDGKPATELSFLVELSDDVLYAGHLDRVVEWNEQGLFWMDQKTTQSTISSYFFDSFKPSNQFLGYTYAGQILLQSPIRGGIIDAAQVAVGFSRFERQPIIFTQEQIVEWRDNTLWTISQAQDATRRERFPMNLSACGNYGGCPFRPICSTTPRVRKTFLSADYIERAQPWDPAVPR